jgi:hypothetical protein
VVGFTSGLDFVFMYLVFLCCLMLPLASIGAVVGPAPPSSLDACGDGGIFVVLSQAFPLLVGAQVSLHDVAWQSLALMTLEVCS